MKNTKKPERLEGTLCPLLKKDVSKVCHKCDLYQSLMVSKPDNPKDVYEHWGCTFNLNLILQRNIGVVADGTQKATESFRNEMAKQHNSQMMTLNQVVQQSVKVAQVLVSAMEKQQEILAQNVHKTEEPPIIESPANGRSTGDTL